MIPPVVYGDCLHQLAIKKLPTAMPTGHSDREAFSQLTALFLGVSCRQPVLAVTDFLESAVKKLTQLFQAFEKLRKTNGKLMYFAS